MTYKFAVSSNSLRLRLCAFSARQPVTQLMSLPDRRIAQVSEEARETSFLSQRCSVLMQSFNAVLLHDLSLTARIDDHTRFCIFL